MHIKASSSFIALVLNGRFLDILCPWEITVDLDEEIITVEKRNWYLIGKDSTEIAFKYVRSIRIDEHLLGADIYVKVVGSMASALYLSKSAAKNIRNELMNYNQTKKGKAIIIF